MVVSKRMPFGDRSMSLLLEVAVPAVGTCGLVALIRVCLRHGSDAALKLGVIFSRDEKRRKDCIAALRASQGREGAPEWPELPGPESE
jgi:hypothetical protein